MDIQEEREFNQGVGKYKVLSSNAGVGSVVATKWGGFVMPLSSSNWKFVQDIERRIREYEGTGENIDWTKMGENEGVEFVDDERFVDFLAKTEGLSSLKCLVAVPHIQLTSYNTCDAKNHPLNRKYKERNPNKSDLPQENFTIPAVVFPRWLKSKKTSEFRHVNDWLKIWKEKQCNGGKEEYFAPPRDPYAKADGKLRGTNLSDKDKTVHALLEQVDMVLICPNGHISDIPWDKYFCAKYNNEKDLQNEEFDLFGYDGSACECVDGKSHELQWLENRSNPESFGRLKCKNCGKSVSLEGIMNIKPLCHGEKPWEGKDNHEPCDNYMRWAMVTGNSVYYAETFDSLYIPRHFLDGRSALSEKQKFVLDLMCNRWYEVYGRRHPGATMHDYLQALTVEMIIDKALDGGRNLSSEEAEQIKRVAEEETRQICEVPASDANDIRENYRYQEYFVFQNNADSGEDDKLKFKDIDLPDELKPYFHKIQQVSVLGMTTTQLNFSRVQMLQPKINDTGKVEYLSGMKIYKGRKENVTVLPANQTFGEGLFFSFNTDVVETWSHQERVKSRYKLDNTTEIYQNLKLKMEQRGGVAKFYLLHTFSHVLMKELEFSCGYPTASLKERLYFSDRMCGVLIYTADGSEGSMGGLVWQGQPSLIKNVIKSAMLRALDCASDPICWEHESEGDLNYAACFSCAMVSETSCEERNVGLDRRALVDEEFGYFKNLIG